MSKNEKINNTVTLDELEAVLASICEHCGENYKASGIEFCPLCFERLSGRKYLDVYPINSV